MTDSYISDDIARTVEKAREQFYAISLERIEKVRNLLTAIKQDPRKKEQIQDLHQLYHRLAGSGGLYDMGDFCDRAIAAEDLSAQLGKQDLTTMMMTVDQLMRLTNNLYHLLMAYREDRGVSQRSGTSTSHTTQESLEALKRTIFLVGNSAVALTSIFKDLGFKTESAQDFAAARAALFSKRLPDGLLIDTSVKGGSPLELARLVRQKPDSEDVPIVLVGEEGAFNEKITSIQAGCDDFWNSRAELEVLSAKATRVFERICTPRYKILVVEDDPVQAAAMHAFLDSAGFEPMVMTDPKLFEEGLLASQPDLILLDLILGEMSGFDLAKFVRQNDKFDTTPIVFLTTQNQLQNQVRGKRLGDDYLIKPATPELLVSTIAGRIERYRAIKSLVGRDGLTGSLAYAEFMNAATRIKRTASINPVLLVLDIDGLASINDRYSFSVGEKVISQIGDILKRTFREFGVVGRLSGDEFAVVADSLSVDELLTLVKMIKDEFERTNFKSEEGIFNASVTFGVASLKTERSVTEWLDVAYRALAEAKRHGPGSIIVH
ncbi:MAG: response regulator [Candidatus Obscuribacterales bacterium]|nr:response regulator [Candidatus Obscuribacterales bacterium]